MATNSSESGATTTAIAVEHLASARDCGLAEYLVALGITLQEPELLVLVVMSGTDEVVAPHGHVAAVHVTKAAHRDAQADLSLDQLGRESFTEIA